MPNTDTPETSFLARLVQLEQLLHQGSKEALEEVRVQGRQLEEEFNNEPLRSSPRSKELHCSLLTALGHAERLDLRLEESINIYNAALAILGSESSGNTRDQQAANLLTCRGLAYLSLGDPVSLKAAASSFEEAIALRDDPATDPITSAWGLAASWLNRADALAQLGGLENLQEALHSTDRAREVLAQYNPGDHPPYLTRMALSWMKKAEFLTRLIREHHTSNPTEVFASYEQAINILRPGAEAGVDEARRVLAVVLTNLSRARLVFDKRGSLAGENEGRAAIQFLHDVEDSSPETLALGATARIAVGYHIETNPESRDRRIEITDLAEDGLAILAKACHQHGLGIIDEVLPGELMRLGAEAYLQASPRFLSDFLLDHLDPERSELHLAASAPCHEAAVKTLWKGISEVQQAGFAEIGSEAYETRRTRLEEWEHCRERLAAVRRLYFEV